MDNNGKFVVLRWPLIYE
ncbi:Protein of unknown function [Bacillus cytotoxicus]|uniref:Uncharacterized protein n=1 Tax=Bacillus cytotoxicus TaxID=580165 RepID=A0AAX2CG87_9BACI|nr:Protein of unknown function [Bacillus cytotoxicus]